MALFPFNKDVSVHQQLGDNPNTDNGLSADAIKAMFDRPAEDIKAYLNSEVVPQVNSAQDGAADAKEAAGSAQTASAEANTTAANASAAAQEAARTAAAAQLAARNAETSAAAASRKAPFIATYGVAKYAAIAAAVSDGKPCYCQNGSVRLPLVRSEESAFLFAGVTDAVNGVLAGCSVTSANEWSTYQTTYKKTGAINESGTDDQVPTALAVYKAMCKLEEKIGAGGGGNPDVYVQPTEPSDAPIGSIWINEEGDSTIEELYDSSKITNRQYYDPDGTLVTDVYGWYTTADMDVTRAASLIYGGLTDTAKASNARSVFKDASGGIVSVFLPASGENTLKIPDGAVTVAFTLHMNDTETFYANAVISGSAERVVSAWQRKIGDRIYRPLAKATEKKICCIVDDDTIDTECVTLFRDACNASGIKGTLATLTYNWTKDTDLKNTLLSMEREGFRTIIHAFSQVDAWNDPETNAAVCESNLVQGMQDMQAAGFLDFRYWATPYCKDTAGIQSMARKWGLKCALAGGNTYEPADDTYGRYALRRAAFGPSDADSSISLAEIQTVAREAAQNGGWLIVMTHFEAWRDAGGDYTRFTSLIDYLKGLGYEFMTVSEAWSHRKAVYDVFDAF